MRILKDPQERRSEILDAAQSLFANKGYAKTTIIDILNEVGIAKGTFYYYFKSKEEVLDEIIMRIVEADAAMAKQIAASPGMSAIEKLFAILLGQQPQAGGDKEQLLQQVHQLKNAEMHQKSLVQSILHLSPVLADVVRQGQDEGVFTTAHPQETIEFLLAGAQVIFDEDFFRWNEAQMQQRVTAFICLMEGALGCEPGRFEKMKELLPSAK